MNWKALKQFDQLFVDGEASNELLEIPLGKRILEMEYITVSSKRTIAKTALYDSFYSETFLPKFKIFKNLIERYDLADTNFDEDELTALVKIESDKEIILENDKSQKEIATLYFDSAKYLTKGTRLFNAILTILEVTALPVDEHDQQFLTILHCRNKIPKAVILCENDNQLRKPRLQDIELWFAGGRNTAKLKYVNEPQIPFFYLCDWDNKGIEIFQDIKNTIFPGIQIVTPVEPVKYQPIKSPWKTKIEYSFFPDRAREILERLIPLQWIEEESICHSMLKR